MKLPRLDMGANLQPVSEELLLGARSRRPQPLSLREKLVDGVFGFGLAAAVAGIALGFDSPRDFRIGPAIAFVLALALASRVRFSVGPGFTTPLQLVFFAMLFELPPAAVPVAMAAAMVLAKVPDTLSGRLHPDRLLVAPADAWFSIGPALVFAAAGVDGADWSEARLYLLAFIAQLAFDVVFATARESLGLGVQPRLHVRVMARVYMVDALLTPIALLAAFAAEGEPYRALLVLPLVALLGVFAQEREGHIAAALDLSTAYRGTALLLGDVLEDKDAYTASHSHGVVSLSLLVADALRLDPAARRRVEFGALLHDIGKIAVPAEIINKPGPLDDREWEVMETHTVEGQQMLDRVGGVLADVGRVVRSSHEHWDGSGYPDGLAGSAIPVEARIVCVCDAFSAMTTDRSYRKAMSVEAAREELKRNAGTQFDAIVVEALLQLIARDHVGGPERPTATLA